MTVGSVRGKHMLEIVPRVAQGRRSWGLPSGESYKSVGGQTRFVPALVERVRWPHWAQNGLRVFQSSSARAWPYIAAGGIDKLVRGAMGGRRGVVLADLLVQLGSCAGASGPGTRVPWLQARL